MWLFHDRIRIGDGDVTVMSEEEDAIGFEGHGGGVRGSREGRCWK